MGQDAEVVVPLRQPGRQFSGAANGPVAGRFCAWRGGSDRRYIATVYPVDHHSPDAGLPNFQAFILLAVTNNNGARRVLDVAVVDGPGGRRAALAHGLAAGADEWHVHPRAADAATRNAMVADLRARHGRPIEALCA